MLQTKKDSISLRHVSYASLHAIAWAVLINSESEHFICFTMIEYVITMLFSIVDAIESVAVAQKKRCWNDALTKLNIYIWKTYNTFYDHD